MGTGSPGFSETGFPTALVLCCKDSAAEIFRSTCPQAAFTVPQHQNFMAGRRHRRNAFSDSQTEPMTRGSFLRRWYRWVVRRMFSLATPAERREYEQAVED